MKKVELVFTGLLVPVDFLMVVLAGFAAYALRFGAFVQDIRPVFYELPYEAYVKLVFVSAPLFLIVFALSGLYATSGFRHRAEEISRVFVACSASIAFLIIVIFFQRELFSSRFIVLGAWIISVVFVSAGRSLIRSVQRLLLRRGVGSHGVAVIGSGQVADQLIRELYERPELGYRVTFRLPAVSDEAIAELDERIVRERIDDVILAETGTAKERVVALKEFCATHHVDFKYLADLYETQATHVSLETIGDHPVFEVKRTKLDGWGKITKRTFDLLLASIFLLFLAPVFLLVAALVKIDSVGPVFVGLKRVGERGRIFTLWKFRSMVKDAHALKSELLAQNERRDGPLFKIKNDPRITRVGRLLRKTSIDELPQLLNVLRGEMSLVGPRPHEPEEVARYAQSHRKLLTIKPGMTGFAQISGRSELSFDDEARLDIYYIENWSLSLDLHILARTPVVVLSGKTAI